MNRIEHLFGPSPRRVTRGPCGPRASCASDRSSPASFLAGEVVARCECCAEARTLTPHPELDASRRVCPGTGRIHLDRGDGLYQQDDGRLEPQAEASQPPPRPTTPDVLSDRPTRTGPKTRIELERATFARPEGEPR